MIWNADCQIERFEVLTVLLDDLECKPSHSMIWNADGQIAGFRMQTVEFHSLECEPFKEHLFNWSEVHGIK